MLDQITRGRIAKVILKQIKEHGGEVPRRDISLPLSKRKISAYTLDEYLPSIGSLVIMVKPDVRFAKPRMHQQFTNRAVEQMKDDVALGAMSRISGDANDFIINDMKLQHMKKVDAAFLDPTSWHG